ncbi:MAG: RagB/SusD family nutrient uptake outer membrane protein [Bacteroidota bacterium]
MKRNIIKLSLVVFATMLFFSCNDEFLERYPLDRVSENTFWTSANDLKVYNNSLYNRVRDDVNVPILIAHHDGYMSSRVSVWYLDEFTDNIAPRHGRHNLYQQIRSGKHDVQTGSRWYGWHSNGWRLVREISVGLEGCATALEKGVSESEVNKYKAEQRFFRAMFYAEKVFKFGDVPWVEAPLNIDSEELYGSRTPKAEVMTKVLDDLNFACANLPNDWGDGNAPGRLNRWAALLMKSRICLYQGTWSKYHGEGGDPNMWLTEAANAAKELMDDGPYSLYTSGDPDNDYRYIHALRVEAGPGTNPEVIYWRRYQQGTFTNHIMSYHTGYNGGATKSIVEDYLCTDGKPITLSDQYMGDEVYENIFVNRDPRLRQTILHPDDVPRWHWANDDTRPYPRIDGMEGGQKSTTGYHIIKVYDVISRYATYNTSDTPGIIMRFAEALLNYAEAKAELGAITQDDLDMSINLIRDRVAMPHMTMDVQMDPRYANDGVSALISEIRRERRVELFMEGFRYDDLKRWKQGKKLENPDLGMRWDAANSSRFDPDGKVTIKTKDVDGVTYLAPYVGTDWEGPVFDESKHYLWPLPLGAISQNPELGQNPGW